MAKKKMRVLEPVLKGCVWDGEGPSLELLQPYSVCMVEPLPKADTSPSPEEISQKSQREAKCKYDLWDEQFNAGEGHFYGAGFSGTNGLSGC